MHGFPFAKVSNEKLCSWAKRFQHTKEKRKPGNPSILGFTSFVLQVHMKYLATRKYCFVCERVSDLRPMIIAGARMLDFSII